MPIYEFYCADCHTIYNFFSRTVNTSKRPSCPRCGRARLERKLSRFAISRGSRKGSEQQEGEGEGQEELPPGFDEGRMEQAMEELAQEAENLNEDDPKQMARMMRKLYQKTGLPLGERMEEAIKRMEAGEDPDKIDEEMGDLLDEEESLFGQPGEGSGSGRTRRRLGRLSKQLRPPRVDKTLYDL